MAEQVRIQIDPGTEQVKKFLLTNRYLSSGDINRFKNRIDPDTDHIFCRPQKVSQRISILPPPLQIRCRYVFPDYGIVSDVVVMIAQCDVIRQIQMIEQVAELKGWIVFPGQIILRVFTEQTSNQVPGDSNKIRIHMNFIDSVHNEHGIGLVGLTVIKSVIRVSGYPNMDV